MKTCNKCKSEQPLKNFSKNKKTKDELHYTCKSCMSIMKSIWVSNNKYKIQEYNKSMYNYEKNQTQNIYYRIKNSDWDKNYYNENKELILKNSINYYNNNKENRIKYSIEYNRKTDYESHKKWKLNNPNYFKDYFKNRYKNDNLWRLSMNIRYNIWRGLKSNKNKHSTDILGCTFKEFKKYLESKFEFWMTWDNYGNPKDDVLGFNKSWDLDHIIPISSAKTEEELIKLNHYTNFQPLCSKVNREIKKNKNHI